MNWKFWKKKEVMEDTVESIPFSTLYRWYCYDVGVADVDKLDSYFEYIPISEDAKDMEKKASTVRLDTIAPLVPLFELSASLNAEVVTETKIKELFIMTGLEDESEEMNSLLTAMEVVILWASYAAVVSTFSAAASLGLVEVAAKRTGVGLDDGE